MDIRQIEEASGMTRANIRFYEKEGLLTPERRSNGYRDYSQADVETLKKIKLLRRLELPVETIRRVQQGKEPLSAALAQAEAELAELADQANKAREVCHDLRSGLVSYQTLDAQRYLNRFEERREQEKKPTFLGHDVLPTVDHPWRRFFARWLDFALYSLVWEALAHLVLRWNVSESGWFINWLTGYFAYFLMIFVEPLLLSTLGTTPGKFIFGLEVRDANGAKLTYGAALARTWGVFRRGFGWGIPIYNIVRLVKCCRACNRGETMDWDWESVECGYTIKDTHFLRFVGFAAAAAALLFVSVVIMAQAQMPRHRGEITAEQFVANCNDLNNYHRIYVGRHFEEDGALSRIIIGYSSDGDVFLDNTASNDGGEFELITDDNGKLTAVRIEVESSVQCPDYNMKKQLAVLAFAGADRTYNCFTLPESVFLEAIKQTPYDDYSIVENGFRMTNQVEYEGFIMSANGMLYPNFDREESWYHMVFTLERVTDST